MRYTRDRALVLAAAIDSFLDILSGSLIWITSVVTERARPWDYPAGKSRFEPLGMIVFSSIMFSATLQLLIEGIKVPTATRVALSALKLPRK